MYIDNLREKSRQVTHEYTICDQIYAEMTGIYHKLDYKKQGPYIITEVFTNNTVRFQPGAGNNNINLRRLRPHIKQFSMGCP